MKPKPATPDSFEGKGPDIEAIQKAQLLADIKQAALNRPIDSPDTILIGSRKAIETINKFLKP
jgi:hypothetical protein